MKKALSVSVKVRATDLRELTLLWPFTVAMRAFDWTCISVDRRLVVMAARLPPTLQRVRDVG